MLDPGDQGRNPETGNTYNFKVDGLYNDSTGGMTVEQVHDLVNPTNPGRISSAGTVYRDAGGRLSEHADRLIGHAQRLSGAWGGSSAGHALGQMQQLNETATNLATAAHGVAAAMEAHAPVLADAKKHIQELYEKKQRIKLQLQQVNEQVRQARQAVADESFGTKIKDFFAGSDPRQTRLDDVERQATDLSNQAHQLDLQAARALADLNTKIVGTYGQLPSSVSKNLPPS